jgi:hypothetical protein
MPRYLISFDEGTMIISAEDLPAVARAAHGTFAVASRCAQAVRELMPDPDV